MTIFSSRESSVEAPQILLVGFMLPNSLGQPLEESQFLSLEIRTVLLLKLARRGLAIVLHLEGSIAY